MASKVASLVEVVELKLTDFEKRLIAKDEEIDALKKSLADIQSRVDAQEQKSMSNEVELAGIPEANNENLYHIALTVAQKIGVELVETDLDEVVRVGPRRLPSITGQQEKPRLVVVKFLRRAKQIQFLRAAKSRRNLTSEEVVPGTTTPMYINERLTKYNRLLFREARLRCKLRGFRFCWVRDGAIYVRKAEQRPAIRIRSSEDLDQRVGPAEDKNPTQ